MYTVYRTYIDNKPTVLISRDQPVNQQPVEFWGECMPQNSPEETATIAIYVAKQWKCDTIGLISDIHIDYFGRSITFNEWIDREEDYLPVCTYCGDIIEEEFCGEYCSENCAVADLGEDYLHEL